jgi:hypothetical protein
MMCAKYSNGKVMILNISSYNKDHSKKFTLDTCDILKSNDKLVRSEVKYYVSQLLIPAQSMIKLQLISSLRKQCRCKKKDIVIYS